jgi:hypothetical protein
MTQAEVFDLLKAERKKGDSYFTVREIEAKLKAQGLTNGSIYGIRMDAVRLWESGFLDCEEQGDRFSFKWRRLFRLKKKYI